jgi:hypothetical protein
MFWFLVGIQVLLYLYRTRTYPFSALQGRMAIMACRTAQVKSEEPRKELHGR